MASRRDIYEAVVVDVQDPEQRGRVRVRCRALLDGDTALPDWLEPCFPQAGEGHGWFFIPRPGDAVEIEAVVGDDYEDMGGEAAALAPEMRWRCGLYASTQEVPQVFRGSDYGQRMGVRSPGGATLLLDDKAKQAVLIADKVRLVAEDSGEPLVLGAVLKSLLTAFMDQYLAHTHPTGAGPSGPPLTAAATATTKANFVTNDAILSGVSFTKK